LTAAKSWAVGAVARPVPDFTLALEAGNDLHGASAGRTYPPLPVWPRVSLRSTRATILTLKCSAALPLGAPPTQIQSPREGTARRSSCVYLHLGLHLQGRFFAYLENQIRSSSY